MYSDQIKSCRLSSFQFVTLVHINDISIKLTLLNNERYSIDDVLWVDGQSMCWLWTTVVIASRSKSILLGLELVFWTEGSRHLIYPHPSWELRGLHWLQKINMKFPWFWVQRLTSSSFESIRLWSNCSHNYVCTVRGLFNVWYVWCTLSSRVSNITTKWFHTR